MRIATWALAAVLMLAALPATAQVGWRSPGLHYFHRVGATLAEHDAAVRLCATEAAKMLPSYNAAAGLTGGIVGEIVDGILQNQADRSRIQANIETCMVIRGWTVIRPPVSEEFDLKRAGQASLIAYLEKRVGGADPQGTLLRRHDPKAPIIYKMSVMPPDAQETISFMAVFGPVGSKIGLSEYKSPKPEWQFPAKADAARLAPGATVIVVRTHGTRPGQQINLLFMNIEERPNAPPVLSLFATPTPTKMFWKAGTPMEELFIFEVPPGRWILAGDNGATFCLGAPVFAVQKGEAVFAGTFSSSVIGDLQPKMDMAPAKVGLPAGVAARLRPADWRNGITFECGLRPASFLNALEVHGAPPA